MDALAPARAWWNRRPRGRTPWLAGGGIALIIVLALAGYLVVVAVNNVRYPPDRPVRDLFAALAARDTGTAASLAGCGSEACTGDALATGYEPPTDLRIGEITYGEAADDTRRPDKSVASVPVTYRLGGGQQAVTMRVQRSGTGLARPFRILAGATGRLAIDAGHLGKAQLGGAVVAVGEGDGSGLTVLPGTYTVQVPGTDPLFAPVDGPARVDVAATADAQAAPAPLSVPVRIRPEVAGQVGEQIRARLAECAGQDTLTPRGCPFRVSGIVIGARDIRWTVLRPPAVEVVPAEDPGPTDPPATVRTVTPGQADVTYTAYISAGGARTTVTRQFPIEVTGAVEADPATPGRVVWSG